MSFETLVKMRQRRRGKCLIMLRAKVGGDKELEGAMWANSSKSVAYVRSACFPQRLHTSSSDSQRECIQCIQKLDSKIFVKLIFEAFAVELKLGFLPKQN